MNKKMNQVTADPVNQAQLRWRCRRGMLELDIILNQFFDKHYLNLASADKQAFQALLDQQDPTLLAWLVHQTPPPSNFLLIVDRIIAG